MTGQVVSSPVRPSEVIAAAIDHGGEDVLKQAFDAANAFLGFIADEANWISSIGQADRGTLFCALTAAYCAGYMHRETEILPTGPVS